MKISTLLHRRLHWINLPGAILMMLLQRMPVLNVVAIGEEMVISSPVGTVLKSVVAAVAALGAVNSMAGATPLTVSAGTSTGITISSGTAGSVSISLAGANGTAMPPASWTVSGAIPPGMNYSTLTTAGTANVNTLHLGGTPTTAGVYAANLQTFSGLNGTGQFESMVYTYTVTVTSANVAPAISAQPANQSVTAGASASFTAAATGTPTPTLQWQRQPSGGAFANLSEGGSYTGTATGTLMVSGTTVGMSGDQFRCVATNSVSSATSNAATLTVNPVTAAPLITLQPSNQTVTAGNPATFTAAASGGPPPTLQWQRQPSGGAFANLSEGGSYTGTTTGSLTVSGTTVGMSGDQFRCVASNSSGGPATSNAATLTVNPVPVINSISYNSTTFPGTATPGATVMFTYNVTNTGTNPWGANHYLLVRDPANNNLFFGSLNGMGPGATADVALQLTAPANPGTYTFYVQGLENGVAYFSTKATLNLVVSLPTSSGFTADFDGDGKADILWSNTSTGDRYIWLMNGGSVAGSIFLGTIAPQWTPTVADFDGDGKADILWSNTSSGDRYFWLMNGGSVSASIFLGTVPTQWTPTAGDLDGDGKADLLWSNSSSGDRYFWLMNGGSVSMSIFLGTVPPQWTPAFGDFNGDGKKDLIWSNTSDGDRYIWLMSGGSVSASIFLGTVGTQWQVGD